MNPRRLTILLAALAAIQGINTGAGYRTNLGANVRLGEFKAAGPDDPPMKAVVFAPTDAVIPPHLRKKFRDLELCVGWAVDSQAGEDVGLQVELALADIQQAIETSADLMTALGGVVGQTNPLGLQDGNVEMFYRHSGSEVTGGLITW